MTRQLELEAMSDFDLNCLVAMIVHPDLRYADSDYVFEKKNGSANFRLCNAVGEDLDAGTYDYCNNPSDIMPIAFENKINLSYDISQPDLGWLVEHYEYLPPDDFKPYRSRHENPYRAMCVVFILLNEDQS